MYKANYGTGQLTVIVLWRRVEAVVLQQGSMFSLADFETHARKVLDKNALDYYSSGADQEQTLRDNVEAFKR